jgi:hypothetical protein
LVLKFKLKSGRGAVSGFTDSLGVTHVPGDIVDLPACYVGEAWLERAEPAPKVAAVAGKFEPVESAEPAVPFEASGRGKQKRKKQRS